MNHIKKYIEENVNLPITEFLYIAIDENNKVYSMEDNKGFEKITDITRYDKSGITLHEYMDIYQNVFEMYSATTTFVSKGHNNFIHSELVNDEDEDGYKYCYVNIGKKTTEFVRCDPVQYLADNIPNFFDLFFCNLTKFATFNFSEPYLTLKHVEALDELFYGKRVARVYKHYNCYFVFH